MDRLDKRLPLYRYLRPLVEGARVLEVGGAGQRGVEQLLSLGASFVATTATGGAATSSGSAGPGSWVRVAGDAPASWAAQRPYDLIVVTEGAGNLVAPSGRARLESLRSLLSPHGFLACLVENADVRDARTGVGFYELQEALGAVFPVVRMFGQTPFAAVGLAEFEGSVSGLHVDSALVAGAAEDDAPTHYLALAGAGSGPALGYGLIQIPVTAVAAAPIPPAAPRPVSPPPRDGAAEARVEAALRVQRAQAEEIEELRARIRRAAESRAELDAEIARLRKALTEADESVLTLTRRTTEEMTALASRLTSGLRAASTVTERGDEQAGAALEELRARLRAREAELAVRESELAERDERIASLEADKQDALWRAEAAEGQVPEASTSHELEEARARLAARERALEEFRRAASVHVDEVQRLRVAVAEHETLATELEESLAEAERARQQADAEAARLRTRLAAAEDADRVRRSRLSELEGTLLRLQREKATAVHATPAWKDSGEAKEAERTLAALRQRVAELEARPPQPAVPAAPAAPVFDASWAEDLEAERSARAAAVERASTAERQLATVAGERDRLRMELAAAETDSSSALRIAEQDVRRLRAALERSEESLHQVRAQLFPLRGRVAVLEQAQASRDAAERSFLRRTLDEVSELEGGLRAEAAILGDLERALGVIVMAAGQAHEEPPAPQPPAAEDTAVAGGQAPMAMSTTPVDAGAESPHVEELARGIAAYDGGADAPVTVDTPAPVNAPVETTSEEPGSGNGAPGSTLNGASHSRDPS